MRLGDEAVYLNNPALNDQILNARRGTEVVRVAAYAFTAQVNEASLRPLVVEALAKLCPYPALEVGARGAGRPLSIRP
jgi:hypothetical protein